MEGRARPYFQYGASKIIEIVSNYTHVSIKLRKRQETKANASADYFEEGKVSLTKISILAGESYSTAVLNLY